MPTLARQLEAALVGENERGLADQLDELRIVEMCECDDDFCHSFYTAPPPDGFYPYREGRARSAWLEDPGWDGYLALDVVDEQIMYVEVLYRPPLD